MGTATNVNLPWGDKEGKVSVGFRLGSFGDTLVVAKPNECTVCPPDVLNACESFNSFIVESPFLPYDYITQRSMETNDGEI